MVYDNFYDKDTLNIFTDASTKKNQYNDKFAVCYGAIAMNMNNIIEEIFRVNSYSTVNEGEAKAIQTGLFLALKNRNKYKRINIFSDSLISVNNINIWFNRWESNDEYVYKINDMSIVKNYEVYIQIMDIISRYKLYVNLYHIKGHIDLRKKSNLTLGINTFKKSNQIYDKISYNFIRYVSGGNNYVDKKSRDILHHTDLTNKEYFCPLKFIPTDFYLLKANFFNTHILKL